LLERGVTYFKTIASYLQSIINDKTKPQQSLISSASTNGSMICKVAASSLNIYAITAALLF